MYTFLFHCSYCISFCLYRASVLLKLSLLKTPLAYLIKFLPEYGFRTFLTFLTAYSLSSTQWFHWHCATKINPIIGRVCVVHEPRQLTAAPSTPPSPPPKLQPSPGGELCVASPAAALTEMLSFSPDTRTVHRMQLSRRSSNTAL